MSPQGADRRRSSCNPLGTACNDGLGHSETGPVKGPVSRSSKGLISPYRDAAHVLTLMLEDSDFVGQNIVVGMNLS